MSVAVVTALYGAYDQLGAPPEQSVDVEWIVVTDGQSSPPPAPWREVIEPRPHLHPRLAAKVPKCRPDLYTKAKTTVFVDAAARIRSRTSVEMLASHLGDGWIAQHRHPERNSIVQEAVVSAAYGKYAGQDMVGQVQTYAKAGLPGDYGLWATGIIVRRASHWVARMGDRWLVEQCRWSWQDQLSEPFVLWQLDTIPSPLPRGLWDNDYVSFDYSTRRGDI